MFILEGKKGNLLGVRKKNRSIRSRGASIGDLRKARPPRWGGGIAALEDRVQSYGEKGLVSKGGGGEAPANRIYVTGRRHSRWFLLVRPVKEGAVCILESPAEPWVVHRKKKKKRPLLYSWERWGIKKKPYLRRSWKREDLSYEESEGNGGRQPPKKNPPTKSIGWG